LFSFIFLAERLRDSDARVRKQTVLALRLLAGNPPDAAL